MAVLKYRDPQRGFVSVPALMGPPGETIHSITQTNNIGSSAQNTITITTSLDKQYLFNYYNGAGIARIEKITDNRLSEQANTIRISCTDNSFYDFEIWNGVSGQNGGIQEIWTSTNPDYPGHIVYKSPATNTDVYVPVGAPAEADSTSTKVCVVGVADNSGTVDTGVLRYNTNVYVNCSTGVLMGAAWNDYAEYRQTTQDIEAGRVVTENGDDTLSLTKYRMMPASSVVSDTFGFAIGETDKAKTPLAMAGRVLTYTNEDRNSYQPGDAVCSGPNGTVSKMTTEEKVNHPECIIGYVSCVPDYEIWGEKNIKVNGRIWIKVV